MKKILVTGGSGRAGKTVIADLVERGYEVKNGDIVPPKELQQDWLCPFIQCNMSDYGQAFAVIHGFDAVVHLAADPRPDFDHFSGAHRFHNNTLGTYNVFNAAVALGIERVVWASSETVYGFPFDVVVPEYVPLDEKHVYSPQSSYAISKMVSEKMAEQFSRLSGIPFIGLQFSNILYPPDYDRCPAFWADPTIRIFDLWSYVDHRDASQAVYKSLQADIQGAEVFIIGAGDSIMNRPSADLMREYFPQARIHKGLGKFQSLICSEKAVQMLGYDPQYSWRDHISVQREL